MQTFLLIVAAIILTVNLILTINESIRYYHVYFPSAEHPGRIRGASEPGPEGMCSGWIEIDGMRYNVRWIIIGREKVEKDGK